MVNVTHLYVWAVASISACWSSEMPELRELSRKQGEFLALMYEAKELPLMYAQCEAKLVEAEANLEDSKQEMAFTLGSGAIAVLQKEIDDGTVVVQNIKSRCEEYTARISEVESTRIHLADEMADMKKEPKGQMMADVLHMMAEEAGCI